MGNIVTCSQMNIENCRGDRLTPVFSNIQTSGDWLEILVGEMLEAFSRLCLYACIVLSESHGLCGDSFCRV